jgi:hypothetical protein
MFKSITLRGTTGSIVWAYRPAAALTAWSITCGERVLVDGPHGTRTLKKIAAGYTLRATLGAHVDRFQLRQRPLLFTAPRTGGFWCWPVQTLTIGERTILASLGPPEY